MKNKYIKKNDLIYADLFDPFDPHDPLGSYTGTSTDNGDDIPEQDADDL